MTPPGSDATGQQDRISNSAALTPYSALVRILDIHYQAQSRRYPEGECAVCIHYDAHQGTVVGDRYPCETRQVAESAITGAVA